MWLSMENIWQTDKNPLLCLKSPVFHLHSKKQLKEDVILQGLDELIQGELFGLDLQLV